jgi:hypothetical protein
MNRFDLSTFMLNFSAHTQLLDTILVVTIKLWADSPFSWRGWCKQHFSSFEESLIPLFARGFFEADVALLVVNLCQDYYKSVGIKAAARDVWIMSYNIPSSWYNWYTGPMSIITFRAKSNIRNSNVTNCSPQQKACHSAPRIYNNLQMQSKSTAADSVEHRYTSVQKCYIQSLYNRKNKIPGLSQVSDKMDYR